MNLRLDPADFEFQGRRIPEHMHRSIREYLVDHLLDVDDFLAMVLINDLKEAVAAADHVNLWKIPVYVAYFHNYAPYNCWGSVERVRWWLTEAKELDEAIGEIAGAERAAGATERGSDK